MDEGKNRGKDGVGDEGKDRRKGHIEWDQSREGHSPCERIKRVLKMLGWYEVRGGWDMGGTVARLL